MLDAGAHIGDYGLCLAKALLNFGRSDIHVYCLDPCREKCEFMRAVKKLNDLTNVTILCKGLWNEKGTFSVKRHGLAGTQASGQNTTSWQFTTLDSLYEEGLIKDISFFRLNAQLSEAKILDGGRTFLSACKPLIFMKHVSTKKNYSNGLSIDQQHEPRSQSKLLCDIKLKPVLDALHLSISPYSSYYDKNNLLLGFYDKCIWVSPSIENSTIIDLGFETTADVILNAIDNVFVKVELLPGGKRARITRLDSKKGWSEPFRLGVFKRVLPSKDPATICLNLGCGDKLSKGFLNIDKYDTFNPDKVMDLERFPWDLPSNMADYVLLNHVLEHLGRDTDTFLNIMKELYRICKPEAVVQINVPHPLSQDFRTDPTHVRRVTPEMFEMFSKPICEHYSSQGFATTPLATILGVDFRLHKKHYTFNNHTIKVLTDAGILTKENSSVQHLVKCGEIFNNLIQNIDMTLSVHKTFVRHCADVYLPTPNPQLSHIPFKLCMTTHYPIDCIPTKVFENLEQFGDGIPYTIYSDKDCVEYLQKYYGTEITQRFQSLKGGMHKADLFRYCYLYREGGLYMDIKTELIKNLKSVFAFDCNDMYTCLSVHGSSVYQGIICCKPGLPVFQKLINTFMLTSNLQITDNLVFTKQFFDILQDCCCAKVTAGLNVTEDKCNIVLFEEKITPSLPSVDRYGIKVMIYNAKGQPVIKTRFDDYPWNMKKAESQPLCLHACEKKIFSQNGEDGVTLALVEKLLKDVPSTELYFVEFGVENGKECNTRVLREQLGWSGLQMDGGFQNEFVQKEFITKENVVALFKKYAVPPHINVLSVDIDFNDFYCLKAILKNYTCDIIICEYNSSHGPQEDKVVPYNATARWDGTNYFGLSLLCLTKLCNLYNYALVYCDSRGVNAFFVQKPLLARLNLEHVDNVAVLYRPPLYGHMGNNKNFVSGHPPDPQRRPYLTFEEAMKST